MLLFGGPKKTEGFGGDDSKRRRRRQKTHLNLYVEKFGAEIYFQRQSAVGNFCIFFLRAGTQR